MADFNFLVKCLFIFFHFSSLQYNRVVWAQVVVEVTVVPARMKLGENGTGSNRVRITCKAGSAHLNSYKFTLKHKDAVEVATSDSTQYTGVPQLQGKYDDAKRATVSILEPQGFVVTLNRISCEDAGIYHCKLEQPGIHGDMEETASLAVLDGLQQATLTVHPANRNVTEGEPMKMTCHQVYGTIEPNDPRTRPKQVFWRWEFRQVKSSSGFTYISGALSIFKTSKDNTVCKGEVYESVMTFYPEKGVHDEAMFRCYLMINLQPVNSALFASYLTGTIGAPKADEPLVTIYKYTSTSLMTFVVGGGGFMGSIVFMLLYFINKNVHFMKKTAVPQDLLEEERELEQLEMEINRELLGGGPNIQTLNLAEEPEESASMMESSVAESSVAESSVAESSFTESSVAGEG